MTDVSRLLEAAASGDQQAASQLLPLVYDELRKLAAVKMAREKQGQTLDATALVHEAYLRLVGNRESAAFANLAHFFAAAAEAMRRILIDQARRKASEKAGGNRHRIELAEIEPAIPGPQLDLLALDEALTQFQTIDPRAASVVSLRFFAGMTMPQVAQALDISLATAENDWAYAKCYLRLQLGDEGSHSSPSR